MKNKTAPYYQKRVEDVLNYINNHLGDNLNVKMLSEKFGISFFYFHRILKAFLNEPLGNYINRMRLETAIKLIRYSGESLTSIANSIGYNDVSSFSKAFSKEFGLSPNEFKKNTDFVLNTHVDYSVNKSGQLVSNIKPKMITLPDKEVMSIRVVGKYGGHETYQAWDELMEFAAQHNLIGWKSDLFTVYYDEPEEVGTDNCTSNLCVVARKPVKNAGRIKAKIIEGGRYAVFRYKGPYERLWELYEAIYRQWVLTANIPLSNRPLVEKYLNYSFKTKPEDLLTEIYIPVEPQ